MKETYEFRMQMPIVQRPISADLDELTNIITQQGDVQQHNTNVKASMTEWDLNSKHFQVEKICNHAIKVARSIHPKSFNSPEFYTRRCWGASYTKNQYTKEHNHTPNLYSWCYYVRMPDGASPLIFSEAEKIIYPNAGDLILFSSLVRHYVPPNKSVEPRIMLAGNISVRSPMLV